MGRLAKLRSDERGISAVLVVISMVAIFGAAVLSVDAGQLWGARRNLVTATDAAVLTEAQVLATSSALVVPIAGCTNAWQSALDANTGGTSDRACSVRPGATTGSGVVWVQSRKLSPSRFSGVLGIGDSRAFSMSAAQWGFVTEPIGLRPIGLCTTDPHVIDGLQWVTTGSQTHTPTLGAPLLALGDYNAPDGSSVSQNGQPPKGSIVHHLSFTASCGGPGNFGWMDLDLQTPLGNPDLADWLKDGYYDNHVALTTPTDCDSDDNQPNEACKGDTGVRKSNDIVEALDYLIDPNGDGVANPLTIGILLYDTATSSGGQGTQGGQQVDFHLVSVAHVRIWGYKLQDDALSGRYLDLQFVGGTFEGICCEDTIPGSVLNSRVKSVRICGVDHDAADPSATGARCTFL